MNRPPPYCSTHQAEPEPCAACRMDSLLVWAWVAAWTLLAAGVVAWRLSAGLP